MAATPEPKVTAFQARVYEHLRQIPRGRVSTYASLARALESSPRAVGGALRRNPYAPEVPCHRIVQADGVAKYKDRKQNRGCTYVGWDSYADATTRGQIRYAYEAGTSIITNFDIMEGVLDYTFLKLGVDGAEGNVDRPIVMTEAVANLPHTRRAMSESLFECYGVPSVSYGIDALFSYKHNQGKSGLIVSSSHSSTHLIPVIDRKPVMSSISRLNWGGYQGAEYLTKLLRLKYPFLPNSIVLKEWQMQELVREHCYVSQDFDHEISHFLDWTGLEERDHIIQYPFTEQAIEEKTAEELARIAERKKANGRRLQEQAAKQRLERLLRKEADLERLKRLQGRLEASPTKKERQRLLDADDIPDAAALDRRVRELEKSVRKARNKDVGGVDEAEEEAPSFPLLNVPDDQLDEGQLKQKRHQRLMKAGLEARQRARAAQEAERARQAEEQRLDHERRETDLEGWLATKHAARTGLMQRLREKERFKADLGNRKSVASQMRMKTLAHLAADQPGRKRRRGAANGNGDDDTFGADDADWTVYRQVQDGPGSDESDEEDLPTGLRAVEALLLEHDPAFQEADTLAARSDWTQSLLHAFLRGPRPYDPEAASEAHQLHLNVERVRVPEVVFRPAIAGLDQAGLVESAANILAQKLLLPAGAAAVPDAALRDVFLTGGNTLFRGFRERLAAELRAVLPAEATVDVRRAADPLLDAWRGAAAWAREGGAARAAISRAEYMEKGSDYLKEHEYGNSGSL